MNRVDFKFSICYSGAYIISKSKVVPVNSVNTRGGVKV
jgi:hypothetical protein